MYFYHNSSFCDISRLPKIDSLRGENTSFLHSFVDQYCKNKDFNPYFRTNVLKQLFFSLRYKAHRKAIAQAPQEVVIQNFIRQDGLLRILDDYINGSD